MRRSPAATWAARGGTLAIMVGGEQADFDRAKPLFEIMGENIALMGPAGSGQHTKMSNQILIASTHDRGGRVAAVRPAGGARPGRHHRRDRQGRRGLLVDQQP